MTKANNLDEHADFSLVLGGPLFQLYRRAYLSGDALELVRRRVVVIMAIAWLPLLVLSMIGGHVLGGAIAVPFLYDLETHVRFLIALPVLICADLLVHNLIRPVANTFLERRIIIPDDIPKFHKAIDSTLRLRKSLTVEIALLVLVYTFGLWIWRSQVATAQQAGMRCQKRRICISHLPGIGMPSLVFLSSNSSCCVGTFGCFSGFSFFGVSQG